MESSVSGNVNSGRLIESSLDMSLEKSTSENIA